MENKGKRKKNLNIVLNVGLAIFCLYCFGKLIFKFIEGYKVGLKRSQTQQIEQK